MPDPPAWKHDFPVAWEDDHLVTRRAFAQSLVWVSGAAFAGNAAFAARASLGRAQPLPARKVAEVDELPVGGAKVFAYPEEGDACVLVRLDADTFVAFGQRCTHLGCPVVPEPAQGTLQCPCHEGLFRVTDGRVLSGPPPRPLPRVELARRGQELWAVGVRS
ncbi:MAG: Rieske (2Fe-2S) protein [Acidobacteria bacterium]|nr:MAG: Rieske (2Fe-2S) protein [Acidobacteriota bacterium]